MDDRTTGDRQTRRAFLVGASTVGVFGSAGCGGILGGGRGKSSPSGPTLPTPVLGDPDADVTVMAFEDYACGHCARYVLEQFPKLASEYIEPGTVRYEHREFPIPLSKASWRAPNAARAVQDTVGEDAYWEFSHRLFANQRRLGPSLYADLAEQVGAGPQTVKSAALNRTYDSTIERDRQKGESLGVEGTPAIFVNGSAVRGYGFSTIAQAIEAEL